MTSLQRVPRAWRTAAVLLLTAAAVGSTTAARAESAHSTTHAAAAAHELEVVPGGIVRWSGDGISACEMDGESWPPYGGACWFPVDLMRPPGDIELARRRKGTLERATVALGDYPYPTQRLEVAPEMVSPPAHQLERIRHESERVAGLWDLGGPPRFELPLARPLEPQPEPKSFGARRIFNGEPRDPHTGIDLRASTGTPVFAAAGGRVAVAAEHYFAGRCVFLDHGGDLVTMYFHLDQLEVAEGDVVERGQRIGTVGSTGRVTGPHLHFGVRWHGARIDPVTLLGDPAGVADLADAGWD